jgi:hypothetical protein
MDYVLGKPFVDCFDDLNYDQKNKTAMDLAFVMSQLFSFTSSYCGTLLRDQSLPRDQCSPRYNNLDCGPISMQPHSEVSDGSFLIGPVSNIALLDHGRIVPPADKCGPFSTERQFLEAFAYLGSPATRPTDKLERWSFDRLLEVYDVVRPSYTVSNGDVKTFHFAHGDLSVANILLNPDTGAITGVIDCEMAGFRPTWLVAACATWFDDDCCRFIIRDHQNVPDGYGDETDQDAQLRQHYSSELMARNQQLFQHNRQGVELRAIFYNLCNEYPSNVEMWLVKYKQYHWDVGVRGPFPFDLEKCIKEGIDLFQQ